MISTDQSKLEQARYWWNIVRANPHAGTMRGFCESVAELDPDDQSPEARRYRRDRGFFLGMIKAQEREQLQAVRRAERLRYLAPVWGMFDGLPIVHASYQVGRYDLVWHCPYCGERHCRSAHQPALREDIYPCLKNEQALCLLIITTMIPWIPAYIPQSTVRSTS